MGHHWRQFEQACQEATLTQGDIGPEQPRWYTEPRIINVRYEEIAKGPFAEEVAVLIRLNGESKSAFVPTLAVNETDRTVKALAIGQIGGMVLVELPSGSMGKTILQMNETVLQSIVSS